MQSQPNDDGSAAPGLSSRREDVEARDKANIERYLAQKDMSRTRKKRDFERDWAEMFPTEQALQDAIESMDRIHYDPFAPRTETLRAPIDPEIRARAQASRNALLEENRKQNMASMEELAMQREAKRLDRLQTSNELSSDPKSRPQLHLAIFRSTVLAFCAEKGFVTTGRRTPDQVLAALEDTFSEDELCDITSIDAKDLLIRTRKVFKSSNSGGVRQFKAADVRELLRHLQDVARQNAESEQGTD